jgi:PKD repeat protein
MLKKLAIPLTIVILLLLVSLIWPSITSSYKGKTQSLFQTTSVYAQGSRIMVEGTDYTLIHELQQYEQLEQLAASASPRILVEYADSALSIDLEPPVFITNKPPVANAGADQTVTAGAPVTMDGSASRDTDGSIVTYEWDFGDDKKSTGKTVTHTYSDIGTYIVTLIVTDNQGIKSSDMLTVEVTRENHPPVISSLYAEEEQTLPETSVTIKSTVSDADGDTITYRWSANDGSFTGTGSTVSWSAPDKQGIYSITLEVDDGHGGVQRESITIRVTTETIITPSSPQQPYVDLYGHKTDVNVGEEVILYLSAVNPITSPGTLIVQLTLRIPSGWSITSSGFAHGGGGLRTNTYEIGQGPNPKQIEVHILANEPFEGEVVGFMDYYFGEGTKYHNETGLPVTASPEENENDITVLPSTTSVDPKSGGISGTIIAVIIGICTATFGGIITRLVWKSMNR